MSAIKKGWAHINLTVLNCRGRKIVEKIPKILVPVKCFADWLNEMQNYCGTKEIGHTFIV